MAAPGKFSQVREPTNGSWASGAGAGRLSSHAQGCSRWPLPRPPLCRAGARSGVVGVAGACLMRCRAGAESEPLPPAPVVPTPASTELLSTSRFISARSATSAAALACWPTAMARWPGSCRLQGPRSVSGRGAGVSKADVARLFRDQQALDVGIWQSWTRKMLRRLPSGCQAHLDGVRRGFAASTLAQHHLEGHCAA